MIRYIFFLLFINFPFESKLKKAIKKYEKGRYEKAIDILKSKKPVEDNLEKKPVDPEKSQNTGIKILTNFLKL